MLILEQTCYAGVIYHNRVLHLQHACLVMYTMTGATLHLIVLAGVGPQTSDLNPTDLFLIFLITQFFTINLLKQWLTIVAHLIYIYD